MSLLKFTHRSSRTINKFKKKKKSHKESVGWEITRGADGIQLSRNVLFLFSGIDGDMF